MAATTASRAPPESLTLHARSRVLELAWPGGAVHRLPFELLRVCSPSAEVQGHGPGQETLQTGKRDVGISQIVMVGHYAVQPTFSDGHDTGLYTWEYLYRLGSGLDGYWQRYLQRLAEAGVDRDAPMAPKAGGACGHP